MEKSKIRIALGFLIIVLISLSLTISIQAQTVPQTKGSQNIQTWQLDKGKPANTKPTSSLSDGQVSELSSDANKYAIIIGISDYDGTANDLNYCDDDAKDFYKALTTLYGWNPDNIISLIDGAATKAGITAAIETVREKEGADDEVVFFYSGHGSISNYDIDDDGEKKDECILPSNFPTVGAIWDGELKTQFSTFNSERIMFFFDSCYAGGMIDLAASGRLILMACGENQLSLESSAWVNGQFTYYFVDQGMLKNKADANADGKVTFEEAFVYAKVNCQRQSPTASDNFLNDMLP